MSNASDICPVSVCENFTRSELKDLREKNAWGSWQVVMERVLARTDDMARVYQEITSHREVRASETCASFRLILEIIWASGKLFDPDSVSHKKEVATRLSDLHDEIIGLSAELSKKLRQQRCLTESEDFSREHYLDCMSLLNRAGRGNGHYTGWLQGHLESLDGQFDSKYWPSVEEIVEAIGEFESEQTLPKSHILPDEVMSGRSAVLKNFVLGFEYDLKQCKQIPNSFKFSNAATADIANVVLDLPVEHQATDEAVRIIRHRKNSGAYRSSI